MLEISGRCAAELLLRFVILVGAKCPGERMPGLGWSRLGGTDRMRRSEGGLDAAAGSGTIVREEDAAPIELRWSAGARPRQRALNPERGAGGAGPARPAAT